MCASVTWKGPGGMSQPAVLDFVCISMEGKLLTHCVCAYLHALEI